MNEVELYSTIRQLVGDPPPDRLSQRTLSIYVIAAMEWFASECKYLVKEDNLVTMVPGQVNYPLPPDVGTLIWISYNNDKIPPSSTWTWDRDGFDWRAPANPGTPSNYAVQGREIFLNPSPSTTIVSANPTLRGRWFAAPSPREASEQTGMSELDSQIIAWQAATLYLMVHRSPENDERKLDYMAWVQAQMPGARARAYHPIEDYDPTWRPKTARLGPAR
jgi:hypothetical protein